jgi:predicted outer membrane protein
MTGRRGLVLGLVLLATRRVAAQEGATRERVARLHSAALLQERAATLAAARDTRPEVKAFAAEMSAWRHGQLGRLRGYMQEVGMRPPPLLPEHEAAWEGLEPLDYLALTRRYAELQVQALEWEIRAYEEATRASDPSLAALAREMLPDLRRMIEGARGAHAAAGP